MSIAKKIVARGPHNAQVRRYRTDVSSSSLSAPIILAKGSAAKNIMLPISTEARKISIIEQENTLLAVL